MWTHPLTGKKHKYGRGLKPVNPQHKRLFLSRLIKDPLTGLPPAPPTLFIGGTIPNTDWLMQGNDVAGDCGPAAFVHADWAWQTMVDVLFPPDSDAAIRIYSACTGYDPSQTDAYGNNPTDQGVDPFSFADWLVANGYAKAWAQVDHAALVQRAQNAFGGTLTAVSLPDNAETQFDSGQGWSLDPAFPPDPNDGHFVFENAYNHGGVVTWGRWIPVTPDWFVACVQLRIVLFSEDQMTPAGLDRLGIDEAKLMTAIEALKA